MKEQKNIYFYEIFEMKCIECDNERDLIRSDGYFRTRCRKCWNKYCKNNKINHKEYYANYMKKYIPNWRKTNKSYLKYNNKSNKKAISELKNSYLKNRVMDGEAWNDGMKDFLEIKKAIIKIYRVWKKRITTFRL